MKHKFLTIIALCIALLCCIVGLTACGDSSSDGNGINIAVKNPTLDENNKIVFKSFTVTGRTVNGKVSNDTEIFYFNEEIEIKGDAEYSVYSDFNCNNEVKAKTVHLYVGNNTYYVLETCGAASEFYTVTIRRNPIVIFRQNGFDDIVKEVENGDEDIPLPKNDKVGYTAKWSIDNFENINSNITVYVVYEKNNYKVYFDYEFDGSEVDKLKYDSQVEKYYQTVVFDELYNLYKVQKLNYSLLYYNESSAETEIFPSNDVWQIPHDIIVKPVFIENSKYVINFFYGEEGKERKEITKNIGETIDEVKDGVPALPIITGYDCYWATADGKVITSLDEILNTNAILSIKKVPKSYTIHYSAGKIEDSTGYKIYYRRDDGSYVYGNTYDQTVYYGGEYSLKTPYDYSGYNFVKWIDVSTGEEYKMSGDGIWRLDEDLYLEAVWTKSNWSGHY